jgi:ribosomal protein S18 acetylase RimI-like enzyme
MDKVLSSILNTNPTKNIAIKGFFSNNPVEEYIIEGDSVIIFGRSDHLWAHIASSSAIELSSILAKYHKKTKYYFSVEDWMMPLILNHGTSDWIMTTNRYILDLDVQAHFQKSEIIQIDKSYAPFIYKKSDYKEFISIEYVEERLSTDISAGIWINNNLVAWGFAHDDGALGFLHVLNKFRGNGYAGNILEGLISMRKKEKKPMFVNIVPDNIPAINLVSKFGFKFDRKVSWIKLK